MTDNNEQPQIQVSATPAADQAASLIRTVVLSVSVLTAVAGFVSKRDLTGFIAYIQTNEFLAALATLIALGTLVWGQWKTRHRAKQLANIAADPRVPDAVVVTK